ncbi:MAG: hypothetical protein II874_06850 [Bacteroidales bacterium]|nr:hypothetical protein [Bacteroidales bacterium]
MLQFKPYPSIGSHTDTGWMALVRAAEPAETLFAVQEKVDGANVSFLCDDLEVRMARRTAILDPLEPFFGFQQVLERYSGHVYHIYNRLRLSYPEMTSIAVYGELFGGHYPHPGVAPEPQDWPVQKGIWYIPGHDFYAFDIYVFTKDGGFFLPVREAIDLFAAAGFHYAHNLFTGTLDECLAYPCDFPTTIPPEYGLPSLENNLCEGIVIKPLRPLVLPDGSRIAVKVKNPAFLSGNNKSCNI